MIRRTLKLYQSRSFFLFGARGTGKTSLLDTTFESHVPRFNLLRPELFRELQKRPEVLLTLLPKSFRAGSWVIIDEVQRVPEILNLVHDLIESRKLKFALTGSSARKLKRSGANLLSGRALIKKLFPFTHEELSDEFNLQHALQWGTLPLLYGVKDVAEKRQILEAYVDSYIREEIREEQIVRKLDPFLRFLEIAARMGGEIINASTVARDAQTEVKTVQRYYEILEDTLLGFHLDAYHESVRKAQRQAPKFYFFDNGVSRALAGLNGVEVRTSSSDYGRLFESFFINEVFRLNEYHQGNYQLSYLRTKDDLEIDLILKKPRQAPILIEIKSSDRLDERRFDKYARLKTDLGAKHFWVACQEKALRRSSTVEIMPWQKVLVALFS